jgi:bacteriophage HK97-gp10 putative tail-component
MLRRLLKVWHSNLNHIHSLKIFTNALGRGIKSSPFLLGINTHMKIKLSIDKSGLIEALNKFPNESRKEFRIGMKQAAQVVQEEAKEGHRFTSRSNKIEDSIKIEVNSTGTEAKIYLDENISKHGKFIHEGTKAHKIEPTKYKALRWVSGNGRFGFSKGHMVKGIIAEPFLDNALKRKRSEISLILQNALSRILKNVGLK